MNTAVIKSFYLHFVFLFLLVDVDRKHGCLRPTNVDSLSLYVLAGTAPPGIKKFAD